MPRIPAVAALLADPARARMLWMLIDGSRRPAGELARGAEISAQSASAHLSRLLEGGLVQVEAQGRHRYFCLAGADVAAMIETIATLEAAQPRRDTVAAAARPPAFVHARTCYRHLAGEVAVRLLQAMRDRGWLEEGAGAALELTASGEQCLQEIGIDTAVLRAGRRRLACTCVDLTQRRHHLGGALGDAVLALAVERGWVLRQPGSRIVRITPAGQQALANVFGA